MKIENWERTDYGKNKTIWRHDTGVSIILISDGAYGYKLALYRGPIEHYRISSSNRSYLEHESAKWQRDYNRHLRKIN